MMNGSQHSLRLAQAVRSRRGSVLVLVLMSTMVLIFVTLYYSNSMTMEYRAADNAVAGYQAAQAGDGARRYIINKLRQLIQQDPGRLPDPTTYPRENVGIGDAAYWIIGRDYNQTSSGGTNINTTNFTSSSGSTEQPVYGLVSEASKLNLNTITVAQLELLPDMTEDLANAIIDWRTVEATATDQTTTLGGGLLGTEALTIGSEDVAEAQQYLLHDPPFNNKSAPFETVDELRMIFAGMDPTLYVEGGIEDYDLLTGEDANRNGMLDPNENDATSSPPRDNADSHLDYGLLEYCTVCTREPNKQIDGSARIDITSGTAATQLQSLLETTFDSGTASTVMGVLTPLLAAAATQGAPARKSRINSILQLYSKVKDVMTADQFAQIEDAMAPSSQPFLKGLVNVNTAPLAVLECVPGIDETVAPEIISNRQGRTTQDLRSIAWVADVLSDDQITSAGPYLTTRAYQFSADVVTLGHKGRGMHRDLYIIDTADGEEPRVIYRRDLSRLGWPLGDAIREQLRLVTQQ